MKRKTEKKLEEAVNTLLDKNLAAQPERLLELLNTINELCKTLHKPVFFRMGFALCLVFLLYLFVSLKV